MSQVLKCSTNAWSATSNQPMRRSAQYRYIQQVNYIERTLCSTALFRIKTQFDCFNKNLQYEFDLYSARIGVKNLLLRGQRLSRS